MSEPFTLVTWNIFQGLHHSSTRRRLNQNQVIGGHLATIDADVLILQEAWRYNQPDATWAEELADSLGYQLHQWISDRPSRSRERVPWRLAILTRTPCRRLDDHVMAEFNPFGRRACVRIELASGIRIAGVHNYGIHLLAKGRARSWWRERAELKQLSQVNDVVAGDMNMWGPIVRRDTLPLKPVIRARTFPAPRTHSQIDHVMVSDRLQVIDASLLPDMGSDHLGIRTTLTVR